MARITLSGDYFRVRILYILEWFFSNFSFFSIKFLNALKDFGVYSYFATSYSYMVILCDTFNPFDFTCHFNTTAFFFIDFGVSNLAYFKVVSNIKFVLFLTYNAWICAKQRPQLKLFYLWYCNFFLFCWKV